MEIDHKRLLEPWGKPNPNFASGFDKRSSDSGLLENLYGSYLNSKNQQWLNGGRALIDKTYLKMLWDCYCKNQFNPDFTLLAQRLDNLLRSEFLEIELKSNADEVLSFINHCANQLELNDEIYYVSLLLFFLKPALPIIPIEDQRENWEKSFKTLFIQYQNTESDWSIDETDFKHDNVVIHKDVHNSAWLLRRWLWMAN